MMFVSIPIRFSPSFLLPCRSIRFCRLISNPPEMSAVDCRHELQVQELIEFAAYVACERRAVDEAMSSVQRQRSIERRTNAGLNAQSAQIAPACLKNNVFEKRRSDPMPDKIRMCAHR